MAEEISRPTPVQARVAGQDDLDAVAETLARAFYEDPVWSWAFRIPERGPEPLRAAWTFLASSALGYDWVWCTEGYAAASLWIPPGKPEIKPEEEDRFEAMLERLLGDGAARLFATWECFDRAHEIELLRQPYYYLSLLATHPDHAGNGFGIGLLADNLERIDAEGIPAYLESTNRANDRRYERLGFESCGEFELPEDGPNVVQMWRDPR
jgi:GNAT superfamily N-acetyltransferase